MVMSGGNGAECPYRERAFFGALSPFRSVVIPRSVDAGRGSASVECPRSGRVASSKEETT